jgi:hypothetical protein
MPSCRHNCCTGFTVGITLLIIAVVVIVIAAASYAQTIRATKEQAKASAVTQAGTCQVKDAVARPPRDPGHWGGPAFYNERLDCLAHGLVERHQGRLA